MKANELDLRWGRDPAQRVTIKGLRLFAKKAGPLALQVYVGHRWVTVVDFEEFKVKREYNATATARWIKHCVKSR